MSKMPSQSHPFTQAPTRGVSSTTSAAITTLGALKVILGTACVVAPTFSGGLFLLNVTPQTVIMARLFGSGCAAVGALTWSLSRWATQGKVGRDELRRAVLFNLFEDAVDVASCSIGYMSGMYGLGTLGMLGGGCAALAALGGVGLVGLSTK